MGYAPSPDTDRKRTWLSFGASGSFHGALLLWLTIAAARTPRDGPPGLYDQEIRPYGDRLVWYNLREKLPDIKPAPAAPDQTASQRPRAKRKFSQALASGLRDDARSPQTIVTEAPRAELPKPLPLPNVVAERSSPPHPRIFLPPADVPPKEVPAPVLPDPPRVEAKPLAAASPLAVSTPRPQPLPFKPPPERKPATADAPPPELPDAPRAAAAKSPAPVAPLAVSTPRPQPLPFKPPPDRKPVTADAPPPELPDAPRAAAAQPAAPVAPLAVSTPRPQPLPFKPPPDRKPVTADAPPPELPDAPRATAAQPAAPVAPLAVSTPRPQPLPFKPPPDRIAPQPPPPSIATPAPPVTSPTATGAESYAIASLEPSRFRAVPAPLPSHAAGFSGAPELHRESAGTVSNEKAALVVPNLTAGGGVRDALPAAAPAPDVSARSRLLAELRSPVAPHPPALAPPSAPSALRVASAPDPRLEGRVVYAMAIQMPNVTSYSGSWMVWFAERIPQPGAPAASVSPPEPRHKVDPAYIRSAADQRIEGTVKLAAVIGKDGRVDRIELLSGIDNRLDESAVQALGKWLFEPALRDGAPIEVDAIFEVPFHLAPQPAPKPSR
jgi:TonB family protein